jgi:peptidoglycan lytic transglycosylase A
MIMHPIEFFRRKKIYVPGQWILCGGLCVLLGACSTLGLTSHATERTARPSQPASPSAANQEVDSQTIQASYRSPSQGNTVDGLPNAQDYPIDENRLWVDELDTAPEWTRTPEELPPPVYQDQAETPAPLESDDTTQENAQTLESDDTTQENAQTFQPPAPQEPDDFAEEIELPWVDDMSRASLKEAIQKQLSVMEESDLTQRVRIGARRVTRQHLVDTLHAFTDLLDQDVSEEEFNRRLNEQFELITAGYHRAGRPVLFTGYYTPIIPARRERTQDFVFPLYQKPEWYPETHPALNSRKTYRLDPGYHLTQVLDQSLLTREDIDGGLALSDQELELAWLRDDLERYFLHIQGSGYLAFPDGTLQAVQYMGSNHLPYHSVGKQMIQDGVIEPAQGSMQGMKQYFREHPEDVDEYLFRNNRYIFFRNSDSSPRGSGGAELVPGRSIATDKSLYPAGGLAFITVEKPLLNDELEITGWQKVSRFVVDQDTGSAIKGPGRVDLYFGVGEPAGAAAGHYKRTGNMIYLLKK